MADTTFVSQVTRIAVEWLQDVNDWVYKGTSGTVKTTAAGVLNLTSVSQGYVELTLSENVTSITFPSATKGFDLEILFKQAAGGGYTVAGWPANVALAGGAYTMTATANKYDNLKFRYHPTLNKWIEVSRSQNM